MERRGAGVQQRETEMKWPVRLEEREEKREGFWNGGRNRMGRGWLTVPKDKALGRSIPAGLDERCSEDKGMIQRLPCRYSGWLGRRQIHPRPRQGWVLQVLGSCDPYTCQWCRWATGPKAGQRDQGGQWLGGFRENTSWDQKGIWKR